VFCRVLILKSLWGFEGDDAPKDKRPLGQTGQADTEPMRGQDDLAASY